MMKYELFKPLPVPWTPREYAKKAVRFLLNNAVAALFLDPGLGKTSITLAALKLLFKKKQISKVLVIAPLRVCHLVWPKEGQKWVDFQGLRMVVLHGPKKDELLQVKADLYIINPEGLDWLLQVEKTKRTTPSGKVITDQKINLRRWKSLGFDVLVIDELSKFKHPSSLRYKLLALVHHTFGRRWGLTGSPASNGLMDLFGQCYILDQGRTFGPYIAHYRREYFDQSYDGFSWVLKEGADKKIYNRVKPLALRMAADDYLDMPDLIFNNILVQLPPASRRVYDQMEELLLTEVEEKLVTAANAAVASGKCRQIANGGLYHGTELLDLVKARNAGKKREWANLHDAKTDALEELIDELQGAPLLVAYDFHHDLDRLQKRFGDKVPVIGGGVSMKRTIEIESEWNAGKLKLLFAHPQALAHGLNLQENAQHVCWYSLTWDYELYDQFIRRVFRQGNQHKRVFCHHILAEDTIDEHVMLPALKAKRLGQNALFDALKTLRRIRK